MAVVAFGCTNPLATVRDGNTITYGHFYRQDDEDLKSAQRACNCGTSVPTIHAVDARLRCSDCGLVIKPWEGMLCPECAWPMQRFEAFMVEENGEEIWKQVATKAQREWYAEQRARRRASVSSSSDAPSTTT